MKELERRKYMKIIEISKIFNFIGKVIYRLLILMVIILLMFGIVQRTSDNRGSIGGIKIFTVITGSMIPVYNIGDILIVKEISPENIKIGDDIVYQGKTGSFRDKTITHRVLLIEKQDDENYKIITKGVANFGQDPEINQTQVLGKVIGKVPIINFALKVIFNVYTWIFIPVVILIYKNVKKIKEM